MKIVFLMGNMPQYDHGLNKTARFAQDILAELGMEIDEVNLGFMQIPYFDGIKAQLTDDIIMRIRDAAGVVFASTAQMFSPTAIMQTFLEYLDLDEYNDTLRKKHCMVLAVSKNGGERSAVDYLSRVIQHMGGYNSTQIGLQETHIQGLDTDADVREFIEKETEDFYRTLRQGRKYIIPRDYACRENLSSMTGADVAVTWQNEIRPDRKEKMPVSEIYKKLNLDAFTEQQEKDIQELTKYFAEKYTQPKEETTDEPTLPFNQKPSVAKPRVKTIRQTTQSLPHYFQPQLSNGLTAIIQLNITGAETFDGYLTVVSTECEYSEGVHTAPDITIMADASIWSDVLKNKCTAQKAFMIGGLKVRGNFVLLTKFDTLFKM
jgi:putative sterol carrier protein/multimeric flavodoxin WrbA